jgi:glutamine synthetase
MSDPTTILETIEREGVQTVDLRFTDLRGHWRHISCPPGAVDETMLAEGALFDGSAIAGWRDASQSDMLLKPDLARPVLDPFSAQPSLILLCDVAEPGTGLGYERCPRSLARRAVAHLARSGLADEARVGHQAEFFVFDDVRFTVDEHEVACRVDAEEGPYNSGTRYDVGNQGHRPGFEDAALVVPPVDHGADLRAEMVTMLAKVGVDVLYHHHDSAPSQQQFACAPVELVASADQLQLYKYVVKSVAASYGKTATFLPKPVAHRPGSGMQLQHSLWKDGRPLFAGPGYADLSDACLHFIGGVLVHARALNAFTNPITNSYRRLLPAEAAPRQLAYAALNRSSAIRVPFASRPEEKRVEVRFSDPAANPYLAIAAILMAGLDGIQRQLDPGEPMDRNLYDLPPEDIDELPEVCRSLGEALAALDQDRGFLLADDVFTDDLIDTYIALKRAEIDAIERVPHPMEFKLHYSS